MLENDRLSHRIRRLETERHENKITIRELGAVQNKMFSMLTFRDSKMRAQQADLEYLGTQYAVRATLSALTLMPTCTAEAARAYARSSIGLPSDRPVACTNGLSYEFPSSKHLMEGGAARLAAAMAKSAPAHFAIMAAAYRETGDKYNTLPATLANKMGLADRRLSSSPGLLAAIDNGAAMAFSLFESYSKQYGGTQVELIPPRLPPSPFANPANAPSDLNDGGAATLTRPNSDGAEQINNGASGSTGPSDPRLPPKKRKQSYSRAEFEASGRDCDVRHATLATAVASVATILVDDSNGSEPEME
ncbi:hypothetical protein HYH03_017990 [Edaphochlamys debaryana]|uniref:Uncharacterized protein n=1 Tax=Edaphochlamys debaryana TaxID=47281 RepID=A0A836BPW0_9CHLO|nr:hypothetical protein HYH03_017990 [Edaphochlamys debaryana]|eukprot:KAG2483144.1 hypothetical protein HYH03_017990 [Edaphochlamys debaryana]